MKNELTQLFLLFFSMISGVTILSIHKYLQISLLKRNDNGYLYIAIAFFCWAAMAFGELNKYGDAWRIVFSALNNSFLVLSFSFIDHGWSRISNKIKQLGWWPIAIIIALATVIIGSLDGEENHWSARIDSILSIGVLTLLFMGLAKTFSLPNRKMPIISWLSIISGLLFVFTQIYVLSIPDISMSDSHQEPHLKWLWLEENKVIGELIRLLTRPMLLICILCLALTWLRIGGKSRKEIQKKVEDENMSVKKPENKKAAAFKEMYGVSDEELNILKRLAEGENMVEIAKTINRYSDNKKGGDKLQREVIVKLANKFQLSNQRYVPIIIFAIQKGGINIDDLIIE